MTTASTSIKLAPEVKARVQKLANTQKRTAHWVMKVAIEQYLAMEEKRLATREQAEQNWHSFEATGLHLTLEEADKWLAELEAGHDVEPPTCHT